MQSILNDHPIQNIQDHNMLLIILTLSKRRETLCQFCGGRGHHYHECNTKKNLDKQFKTEGLKMEWGELKSVPFKELINARIEAKKTYRNALNFQNQII